MSQQRSRQGQQLVAEAVRQPAVVSDTDEAFGQDVQEEAAEELLRVESHDALLAAVSIIAPAEADSLSIEGREPMVGDGHAVGVATEIVQHMGRAAEGWLGVDEPLLLGEPDGQIFEPCRITEIGCGPAAVELVVAVEVAQSTEELLVEHPSQCWNGQEEQRVFGVDPSLMIGRQAAAGDDAVDVIMAEQVRAPGVEDGEEPNLGAETLGIGGHFEQGLGGGVEQQIKKSLGAGERQRVEFVRDGEDDVEVVGVEQIALLGFEPSRTSLRLALGTAARPA